MLGRGHQTTALIKGWNRHLVRFAKDKITNYSRLRQWFRRMLRWAQHNFHKYSKAKHSKHIWVPKKTQNAIPDQTPQNPCHSKNERENIINPSPRKIDKLLTHLTFLHIYT